jgi:hypothetical protein
VVESVVLLDRVQYLVELGYSAEAVAVFDERVSPRNVAIVAVKNRETAGTAFVDLIQSIDDMSVAESSTTTISTPPNADKALQP